MRHGHTVGPCVHWPSSLRRLSSSNPSCRCRRCGAFVRRLCCSCCSCCWHRYRAACTAVATRVATCCCGSRWWCCCCCLCGGRRRSLKVAPGVACCVARCCSNSSCVGCPSYHHRILACCCCGCCDCRGYHYLWGYCGTRSWILPPDVRAVGLSCDPSRDIVAGCQVYAGPTLAAVFGTAGTAGSIDEIGP